MRSVDIAVCLCVLVSKSGGWQRGERVWSSSMWSALSVGWCDLEAKQHKSPLRHTVTLCQEKKTPGTIVMFLFALFHVWTSLVTIVNEGNVDMPPVSQRSKILSFFFRYEAKEYEIMHLKEIVGIVNIKYLSWWVSLLGSAYLFCSAWAMVALY